MTIWAIGIAKQSPIHIMHATENDRKKNTAYILDSWA